MQELRARTAAQINFDGVYRPQVWLAEDQWQAVSYVNDGRMGKRSPLINPATNTIIFKTEAAAQEACDRENARSGAARRAGVRSDGVKATREAVNTPATPAIPPDR